MKVFIQTWQGIYWQNFRSRQIDIQLILSLIIRKNFHYLKVLPISELCNLSITLGSFPDACKIAKVKPLFKKGSKTDPSNYRPISLLPLLSKVFERVVLDQTEEFLSLNKILYDYQPGFRKNHSTDACLSFLNDKILKGFDDGLVTGLILIDLQKAFDTINHGILLN